MHNLPSLFSIIMEYTITELRQKIFENVFSVYDVFKHHFGEDYVDLQGVPTAESIQRELFSCHKTFPDASGKYQISEKLLSILSNQYSERQFSIYVWFPKVKVSNENNRSIYIWDLYVHVDINLKGCIPYESYGMRWNRATYDEAQFQSGYMHSHISSLNYADLSIFSVPCLGTASIRDTIQSLKIESSDAMWMLFCEELSRAVTVESLQGVPYKRLEQVGNYASSRYYQRFFIPIINVYNRPWSYDQSLLRCYGMDSTSLPALLKQFTVYYLQHGHFLACFQCGEFRVGMSYYDYMLDVSNAFIDFYNQRLKGNKHKLDFFYNTTFLRRVFVENRQFKDFSEERQLRDLSAYQGKYILTFKGKRILLRIISENHNLPTPTTLLNESVAMHVLLQILKILNFRFKNARNTNTSTNFGELASSRKTVCYL